MATKRKSKRTKKQFNIIATVAFVAIILIVAIVYYFFVPKNDATNKNSEYTKLPQVVYGDLINDFKVHFVDVDKGDGIIIQLPNGQNMLVDAGDNKTASINKLTNYIDSLGITTFDYLIATHSDADHIGGMPTIFERYQINYVYRPYMYSSHAQAANFPEGFNQGSTRSSYSCSTQIYYRFLQCIIDEGSGWSFFNKDSDISFEFKDENEVNYTCTFDFLTPTADISDISYKSNMNNYSPIIKVSYCDYDILLTGDAEKEAEEELLEYYSDLNYLDVDLLKVGHHGSDTSSTTAF
ncbi:MAG: MBL fold metallo-hydrolase, partial [Clostridia bacterium]|nr:MBL fold metallo-hydrolase [Clostridia bacterium]